MNTLLISERLPQARMRGCNDYARSWRNLEELSESELEYNLVMKENPNQFPFNIASECTVVVCCKNSAKTIKACMESIRNANTDLNLLVIDGHSTDNTREILNEINVPFLLGKGEGLTRDRQYGIDESQTKFTLFVDSDHLVRENFFEEMLTAYQESGVSFLQSRLRLHNPSGLLSKGEDLYYQCFHNQHWNKKMIGLAPSIFLTNNLKTGSKWQLFSEKSMVIDDTSWAKRANDSGATFIVSGPEVSQVHAEGLLHYLKKFAWYGKGDADFMLEFPDRRNSMLFHLLIRYPWIFGFKLIRERSLGGFVFVQIQGWTRFFSSLARILILKFRREF
jgi:glycosyltransferase involved in cell wall biosynthesis